MSTRDPVDGSERKLLTLCHCGPAWSRNLKCSVMTNKVVVDVQNCEVGYDTSTI
jgi:hypothetical protein